VEGALLKEICPVRIYLLLLGLQRLGWAENEIMVQGRTKQAGGAVKVTLRTQLESAEKTADTEPVWPLDANPLNV